MSLCSLVDVLDGRRPYLVKLNAEGAEFEIVPDMLRNGILPEWLILMIHPGVSDIDLRALVAGAGYDITAADGRTDSSRLHCHLRRIADAR